ncbi:hypothetical protein SDC9_128671 [bioreactor metagenome]|uniref:Ribosomal-processing cysteine protease Prp n=1 Tax=bioreactor metagenome TaxID=1076179 RepID=A0A645CXN8_9ZZZZ
MLTVKIFAKKGHVYGFEITGHAKFDTYGKDIVCASVSSVAYMVANTLTDVIDVPVQLEIKNSGYMKVLLKDKNAVPKSVSDLLKGFERHIKSLAENYPNNLKVIYGGVTNA